MISSWKTSDAKTYGGDLWRGGAISYAVCLFMRSKFSHYAFYVQIPYLPQWSEIKPPAKRHLAVPNKGLGFRVWGLGFGV